jgi:hypothetical protein
MPSRKMRPDEMLSAERLSQIFKLAAGTQPTSAKPSVTEPQHANLDNEASPAISSALPIITLFAALALIIGGCVLIVLVLHQRVQEHSQKRLAIAPLAVPIVPTAPVVPPVPAVETAPAVKPDPPHASETLQEVISMADRYRLTLAEAIQSIPDPAPSNPQLAPRLAALQNTAPSVAADVLPKPPVASANAQSAVAAPVVTGSRLDANSKVARAPVTTYKLGNDVATQYHPAVDKPSRRGWASIPNDSVAADVIEVPVTTGNASSPGR